MQYTKWFEMMMIREVHNMFGFRTRKRNKVLSKQTTVSKDLCMDPDWDGTAMVSYCKHDPLMAKSKVYKKPKE